MKYRIAVDRARGGLIASYGPFDSKPHARSALEKNGWTKHAIYKNTWGRGPRFTLLEGKHAAIQSVEHHRMRPVKELPVMQLW